MLKKTVSRAVIYDKDGEVDGRAVVTTYYLFGMLIYSRFTDEDAIHEFGVKA